MLSRGTKSRSARVANRGAYIQGENWRIRSGGQVGGDHHDEHSGHDDQRDEPCGAEEQRAVGDVLRLEEQEAHAEEAEVDVAAPERAAPQACHDGDGEDEQADDARSR
jgi:hypothetical protein